MRRLRDRRQAGLFRGGELPRLMSMVVMLFVLAMMFRRASDRDTWRYFTGEPASADQSADADGTPHKSRAHSRPARPDGTVVLNAPEADVQLAMAFEPKAERESSADKSADDAPAANTSSEPATAAAEPKPEPVAAAAEPPAAPPVAKDDSATDAKGEAPAPAESSPEPAKSNPAPAESAPVAEARPAPLFRPNLPANPETFLQPGTEPEKPVIEPGPLDEDAAERREFDHEAEAISDRTPLGQEEMFAYWRLLRWSESQTDEEMLKRARGGVRYGDLLEHPEEYRGELLKERLHIARVRREDAKPGIPFDFRHYYEALGWNDSTQTWFYFCIFVDLPEGMPVGDRVYEEGTFVGYFLKVHVYLDGKGQKTKAPILIGRMIYHPAPVLQGNRDEWLWGSAVAGVMFVLFLARWGWRLRGNRTAGPQIKGLLRRDGLTEATGEGMAIEDWLTQAESQTAESEIKSAANHDLNGSAEGEGSPLRPGRGLDWTEDRER